MLLDSVETANSSEIGWHLAPLGFVMLVLLVVIFAAGFLLMLIKKFGGRASLAVGIPLAIGVVLFLGASWILMGKQSTVPHKEPALHHQTSKHVVQSTPDGDDEFDFESGSDIFYKDDSYGENRFSTRDKLESHSAVRGGSSMVSWVAILFFGVLVIGGIALLIALLSNEKTRPIGYGLIAVGLVGILLVGAGGVFLLSKDESSRAYHRATAEAIDPPPIAERSIAGRPENHTHESRERSASVQRRLPPPDRDEGFESVRDASSDEPRPPEPADDEAAIDGATPPKVGRGDRPTTNNSTASTTIPVSKTSAGLKPDWVERPAEVAGDGTYFTKVSVGPFQNELQCEARLDNALVAATNQYIHEFLYQGNRVDYPVRLPVEYIKQNIMTGEKYTERSSVRALDGHEMVTVHARLEYGPDVQQDLRQSQKSRVLTTKFWYTGIGMGLVLTAILTLFSYLKIDTVTKGFYTRRLQFSALLVILAVLAMGVLLQQGEVVEPLIHEVFSM